MKICVPGAGGLGTAPAVNAGARQAPPSLGARRGQAAHRKSARENARYPSRHNASTDAVGAGRRPVASVRGCRPRHHRHAHGRVAWAIACAAQPGCPGGLVVQGRRAGGRSFPKALHPAGARDPRQSRARPARWGVERSQLRAGSGARPADRAGGRERACTGARPARRSLPRPVAACLRQRRHRRRGSRRRGQERAGDRHWPVADGLASATPQRARGPHHPRAGRDDKASAWRQAQGQRDFHGPVGARRPGAHAPPATSRAIARSGCCWRRLAPWHRPSTPWAMWRRACTARAPWCSGRASWASRCPLQRAWWRCSMAPPVLRRCSRR